MCGIIYHRLSDFYEVLLLNYLQLKLNCINRAHKMNHKIAVLILLNSKKPNTHTCKFCLLTAAILGFLLTSFVFPRLRVGTTPLASSYLPGLYSNKTACFGDGKRKSSGSLKCRPQILWVGLQYFSS